MGEYHVHASTTCATSHAVWICTHAPSCACSDTATGHFYILAQSRLSELYPAKKGQAAAATATTDDAKTDGKPAPKAAGGKKDKKDKAAKPVAVLNEDGTAGE